MHALMIEATFDLSDPDKGSARQYSERGPPLLRVMLLFEERVVLSDPLRSLLSPLRSPIMLGPPWLACLVAIVVFVRTRKAKQRSISPDCVSCRDEFYCLVSY